jgi:hypothetical protein
MYGSTSEGTGGLVMGRQGMRLSEKIASSLTAFAEANSTKQVWNLWNQVNNNKIKLSAW